VQQGATRSSFCELAVAAAVKWHRRGWEPSAIRRRHTNALHASGVASTKALKGL